MRSEVDKHKEQQDSTVHCTVGNAGMSVGRVSGVKMVRMM